MNLSNQPIATTFEKLFQGEADNDNITQITDGTGSLVNDIGVLEFTDGIGAAVSELKTWMDSDPLSAIPGSLSGGTTNAIPVWTGTSSLGNSQITQVSNNIGVGVATPTTKLHSTTISGSLISASVSITAPLVSSSVVSSSAINAPNITTTLLTSSISIAAPLITGSHISASVSVVTPLVTSTTVNTSQISASYISSSLISSSIISSSMIHSPNGVHTQYLFDKNFQSGFAEDILYCDASLRTNWSPLKGVGDASGSIPFKDYTINGFMAASNDFTFTNGKELNVPVVFTETLLTYVMNPNTYRGTTEPTVVVPAGTTDGGGGGPVYLNEFSLLLPSLLLSDTGALDKSIQFKISIEYSSTGSPQPIFVLGYYDVNTIVPYGLPAITGVTVGPEDDSITIGAGDITLYPNRAFCSTGWQTLVRDITSPDIKWRFLTLGIDAASVPNDVRIFRATLILKY